LSRLHSIHRVNLFFSNFISPPFIGKINYILVIVFFIFSKSFAQNQEWVSTSGGLNNQCGKGICSDNFGNCYVTGVFKRELIADSISFTAKGQEDIFLAKYSATGKLKWIKQFGSTDYDFGKALVCDEKGNIFLTGYFGDTISFDKITLISKGNSDLFIAKFDSSGNTIWLKQFGGKGFDFGKDISLDKEDNIFIAGTFQDTMLIGKQTIISNGSSDIFTAKFDKFGDLKWIAISGGKKYDYGNGIAIDKEGNCISTGFFQDTAKFGDTTLISKGYYDIFISKYNNTGELLWVRQAGGSGHDEAHGIGIDNAGNCYIGGYYDSDCYFDNIYLKVYNKEVDDLFIAKYNSKGTIEWAKGAGDFTNDIIYDMVTDSAGNSYATGVFYGKLNLGKVSLKSIGSDDSFVIKYDTNGNVVWANQIGGTGSAYGFAICKNNSGNVFSTGYFTGKVNAGKNIISATDKFDMYINKAKE